MTKMQWIWLAGVVAAAVYLLCFVDWFPSQEIQVSTYVRPPLKATRHRPGGPYLGKPVSPIAFILNKKCRLTELQVVNAAEYATNKYAHPVWHLVSNSASSPTRGFFYGGYIRGMRPSVPNAEPDPLEPNVTYRLIAQAGKLKLEHEFVAPTLRKTLTRR